MRLWCSFVALSTGCWATAQFNTGGNGQQYLSPTEGVTVGTSTGLPPSALTVRGSEMTTPTSEVFRTIGHYAGGVELETNWRMFRLQSNGVGREMGRLYANDSPLGGNNNFNFNVQQVVQGASLWLRNESFDGIRLPDNAANTPSFMFNSVTNVGQRYGYVAIGLAGQMSGASGIPWTRLHLVHQFHAGNTAGFRGFMKNGVTMSGSHDAMYVGQKHVPDGTDDVPDATDALFAWFEEDLAVGDHDYDNATFRFLTTPGAANTGAAGGVEGLEIMRLYPYRATSTSAIEGFVGLGNWAAGANRPSERLDLLDRTIRLRSFVDATAYRNDTYDRVLVANPSDGRVYWRAASTLGAPGCQWSMNTASPQHVWTAFGAASATCPDDAEAVGIGADPNSGATAKLMVETADFEIGTSVVNTWNAANNTGAFVTASGGTSSTTAIFADAYQATSAAAYAGRFRANGVGGGGSNIATDLTAVVSGGTATADNSGLRALVVDNGEGAVNTGAYFDVSGTGDGAANTGVSMDVVSNGASSAVTGLSAFVDGGDGATDLYGLFAKVNGNNSGAWSYGLLAQNYVYGLVNFGIKAEADNGTENYGIWATAPTSCTNCYAVYSEGDQLSTTATAWTYSDEGLKENVEAITNGLERIMALQPKTYQFLTDEYDFMNLPHGPQFGLIAQEVESVIPEVVRAVHRPMEMDEDGNVLHPQLEFKALNYGLLIPIVIAAVQEQNATITDLQQQLADAQTSSDELAAMQDQLMAMQQQMASMQDQLAACCAGGMVPEAEPRNAEGTISGNARALAIQPNPFVGQTTLTYTLDHAGAAALMVNSADGKELRMLMQASMEAGQYQFAWNTADLAPGMYYVTLLLDGESVVKKAVRVRE